MVFVTVPPGDIAPQSIDVRLWVHALSEYTPTFTVVMVPVDGSVWVAVIAPSAVRVRIKAVRVIATVAPLEIFVVMFCPPLTVSNAKS